jgi:hypothetical protein
MRRLAQPDVMKAAAMASAISALLCLPRMLLWAKRPFPVWYVEATLFLGGFVLWAFVFAWHTEYTRRPVFTFKIKSTTFAAATLVGILAAIGLHFFLDRALRLTTPDDYPVNVKQWIAMSLFSLAFTQLLLVFAPFAWLMRLFRNERVAMFSTIAFGVMVLMLKTNSSPTPLPASLFAALLVLRILPGFFAIWFYLRGGILLVSWIGLLIEARHLFDFANG